MPQARAHVSARAGVAAASLIAASVLGTGGLLARDLSFEERVEAQRAIESVYYSHRIGAIRPFEEAVPRGALERKVRTYLSQSVALEKLWNSPIGAGALRRELERIAASTRFPERLKEIYEALDGDPYLIQETFVRATLADRLARNYFAGSPPGSAPQDWETWWESARDEFDPALAKAASRDPRRLPVPGSRAEESAAALAPDSGSGEFNGAVASCDLQDIWSGGATDDPPASRFGHTAVWTGSEMIVWGGSDLNTGSRYDPLTDTWGPLALQGAPAGRKSHTAVWTGSMMIIWGGFVGSGTTLTTGGRYDPVADAWTATSTVDAPAARTGHTGVWTGSEMIVWGGWMSGGTFDNSGGRYDPVTDTWSATSSIGTPTVGLDHAAVWTGSEMIVWGGGSTSAGGIYNPTTDTWRPTSLLDAPYPRRQPAAVWTGTEMVVWGGWGGGYAPGGGRYDPATDTWRPTSQVNAPLNRYSHRAVWTGSRMIVWGGIDFSGPGPNGSVNTGGLYDPVADNWAPTSLAGAPTPRAGHSAVWSGDRMIVWGGSADSSGGRYDPSTDSWTPTGFTYAGPSIRSAHTAVWSGAEMIVWGGSADGSGGRYDPLLGSWTPTSLTNAPSPRSSHTAVWTGQEMIVWGGEDGSNLAADSGGRYDPVSDTWTPTSLVTAPSPRSSHTAVWTGQEMIVWGGVDGSVVSDSGGRYDPVFDTWTPTSLVGAPLPRAVHTAVWTGQEMIVWGGGGDFAHNTGGRYDPASDTWTPTSLVGAPSARGYHTAVWTGHAMITWGGIGFGQISTGGRYDPLADSWTPTASTGAPSARWYHTAVWTGREMIVWGGAHYVSSYIYSTNTGGRYDPVADSWTATTSTNAPVARDQHTAIWTGSAMIVRGGEQWSGDIVDLARDPYVAWYGGETAVPSPDSDQDGFTVCAGDCDDALAAVYPGAPEACDGLDNDCGGIIDEGGPALCQDADACTADVCLGFSRCAHPPEIDGAPCDDADACTVADACQSGACQGGALRDSDGDGHPDSICGGDDCSDPDPAVWQTPAEATGLGIDAASPAGLSWNSQAGQAGPGTIYDLVAGLFAGSGVMDLTTGTCLYSGSDVAHIDTRGDPPSGNGYWYLVRGRNSCGVGTYGTPQRDAAIPPCP